MGTINTQIFHIHGAHGTDLLRKTRSDSWEYRCGTSAAELGIAEEFRMLHLDICIDIIVSIIITLFALYLQCVYCCKNEIDKKGLEFSSGQPQGYYHLVPPDCDLMNH